jgi:hypothetical protein
MLGADKGKSLVRKRNMAKRIVGIMPGRDAGRRALERAAQGIALKRKRCVVHGRVPKMIWDHADFAKQPVGKETWTSAQIRRSCERRTCVRAFERAASRHYPDYPVGHISFAPARLVLSTPSMTSTRLARPVTRWNCLSCKEEQDAARTIEKG